MIVYRVESLNGLGPYSGSAGTVCWRGGFGHGKHCPSPMKDLGPKGWTRPEGRGTAFSDHFFGFWTLKQLRRWFSDKDWVSFLRDRGFTLSIYAVSPKFVLKGDYQLVFVRSKSVKLLSLPVERLYSFKLKQELANAGR